MGYIGNQASSNFSSLAKQVITGNGGASYTLSTPVANANELEIFVNNVRQEPGVAYTVAGTALTMTGTVESTDDFYVVYQGKAVQTVVPPDGSVTSAKLDTNIAIDGTLSTVGNVGIGTATINRGQLQIASSGNVELHLTGSGQTGSGEGMTITSNSAEGNIWYRNNGYFRIATNNTERMRITSAGDVGIGRSDPQNIVGTSGGALVIKSGASRAGTTSLFAVQDSSGNNSFLQLHNGQTTFSTGAAGSKVETFKIANGGFITHTRASGAAQSMVGFKNGANFVGEIRTSTTATSYITSSDYRLKENVTAITSATDRLKQLNPVRFNFISDADTTVDGFIAHEVQDVVPEAISGTKDGMRDEEYTVSAATGDIYTPAIDAVFDEDGNEVTSAVAEIIHSTDVERPEELAEGQQWRETTEAVMGTRSVPVYQGIDQSKLVPLLVKTIQELEARITALEAN